MSKKGTAAFLCRSNHMVASMRERLGNETAIIMPLRPNTHNSLIRIVRKSENMWVSFRSSRVHTVRAMQLSATPPTADSQKVFHPELPIALKNDEALLCHKPLYASDSLAVNVYVLGEICIQNRCPYRIQKTYFQTKSF